MLKIDFTINNDLKITEEDFINKPIIRNKIPIGTIINATKENNNIKIEGVLFDKFIDIDMEVYQREDETFDCSGIELF